MKSHTITFVLIAAFAFAAQASDSSKLFNERILPIFKSPNPSSCTECHLAGVDLKNYILPSETKTFASLRDQGLIDLEEPGKSKILRLINMSEEYDSDNLIDPKVRKAEFGAFAEWIKAAAGDPQMRNTPSLARSELARPKLPDAVIRHGRIDRLLDSYARNVWALRFRCAGCHMKTGPKFEKHHKEHGDKMEWLFANDPRRSMEYLIDSDLVDEDEPRKSKLLLKPLNLVKHGGGQKMRENDTDYMGFLNWIEDYAKVINEEYETVAQLPKDPKLTGSEIWVRINRVPERWKDRTGIVTLHRWDRAHRSWMKEPAALSSFTVAQNKKFGTFLQGFLMVRDDHGDNHGHNRHRDHPPRKEDTSSHYHETGDGTTLRHGEYQLRIRFDEGKRTTSDWLQAWESTKLAGTAGVKSQWRSGWKNTTVIPFSKVRLRH